MAWSRTHEGVRVGLQGYLASVTIGRSRRVPFAALKAFVEKLSEESGW